MLSIEIINVITQCEVKLPQTKIKQKKINTQNHVRKLIDWLNYCQNLKAHEEHT